MNNPPAFKKEEGQKGKKGDKQPEQSAQPNFAYIQMMQQGADMEYQEAYKQYSKDVKLYESNKRKACGLILSHCNKNLKSRLGNEKEQSIRTPERNQTQDV